MKNSLVLLIVVLMFGACGGNQSDTEYPKPRGYFRIDLPEKEYQWFDTTWPFAFKYPVYAEMQPVKTPDAEPYWFNIIYPQFHGMLSFSYKKIEGENTLYKLSEEAREFANKHIIKANEIIERRVDVFENNVHGVIYEIEGTNTASPYQFFLSDSTTHFIRAALYFNHLPNNDSISPIIQRVKEDMDTLISTLRWH
ncbi:MAG: gliding motility lipoprotein GldD [Marinilabiliales bacterium]|nr:MAG: gliding motility lipoprotein GldD [Marinilabiliales bacterium]